MADGARIRWVAEVLCEYGGPAMIAGAADYLRWSGAAPYPLSRRKVLHYWGQFTADLPEPYAQDGGHVYRPAADFDALTADRDALLAAVKDNFEGAVVNIDDDAGDAHVALPDGREMWIEYSPKSHYEEACDGDVAWEHKFVARSGEDGRAVFWDKEGSGSFFVGVTAERDELVLLRTWVDEDKFQDDAKAIVDNPRDDEEPGEDDATLHVGDGPVIVAYAPHDWLGLVEPEAIDAIMDEVDAGLSKEDGMAKLVAAFRSSIAAATDDVVVMLSSEEDDDVAAALALQPGQYTVSAGRYDPEDEDGWSCIWSRFRRVG